jgi:chorismate synthase
MTAPMVIAGAVARQVLAPRGISFLAHTVTIGGVQARPLPLDLVAATVETNAVRCGDPEAATAMEAAVEGARRDRDSVGGVIEGVVAGLPVGVGEPFFLSCESALAALLFSIPAVKGVEFGAGFAAAGMRGSAHNDAFLLEEGRVRTRTNHAGGILGGLSTGMPLVVRVAVKPTASIPREQDTVDLDAMTPATVAVKGRHDPCIVPRAVPVVENALAMGVLDLLLLGGFLGGDRGG